MKRLWDKGEPLDERILRYTAGEDHLLDSRLVQYDVRASIAHANMLNQQKLLSDHDLESITEGLQALAESHARGDWDISLEDEDVHTALEKHLTEDIGEAGKRIHLGRSRNDQVLAALRLYLLDAADTLEDAAMAVADALETLGQTGSGYTVARLYAYATSHAQFGARMGEWFRGGTAGRRARNRGKSISPVEKPPRKCCRLWGARITDRP